MDHALKTLEEKGSLFTEDQGRKVADLRSSVDREEGRYVVLVRANGSSMYMYRDIAYTLEKIDRADGLDIVVLGEDHTMYFEQLDTIIRAMGETSPEAVHYSYILLREGKMSTRQGNVVLLEDFLDEAVRLAREKVDEQWPDLPGAEQGDIARMIGIGAVRFAILSVRPNRNVIFDWETALSFTGDSGPYIQYSCTRISSFLRKYGDHSGKVERPVKVTRRGVGAMFPSRAVPGTSPPRPNTRNPGSSPIPRSTSPEGSRVLPRMPRTLGGGSGCEGDAHHHMRRGETGPRKPAFPDRDRGSGTDVTA